MQTPPPTRDANSRRSTHQGGGNEFATPATVIRRTPNQMPTAEALFNQTPFGFADVQFSPSMMPFSNAGPMSAPPMPQSRLFWDQPNDGSQMEVDIPLGMDPFGPTPHKVEQNFEWQAFSTPAPPPHQVNTQSFQGLQGVPSPARVASFATSIGDDIYSQSSLFMPTSSSVDPSMLFSFSNPDMTSSFGSMPPQVNMTFTNRQPYETQTREAQKEREVAKKAHSQHSRTNTNSSSDSAENVKPVLQRSNTDSGFRKSRPSSIESRNSIPVAASTISRRSSPLKRQGGALTSIPEIRRPRTRLIIDETGRARTETVPMDEEETPRITRQTSQQDVRRQYPGLWDEDDSESEDDEEPQVTLSRNASFNIPQALPQRRSSKHARTDSGGLERANSFKIPRPASRPGSVAFDKAPFEPVRPSVRRVVDDNPHRRFSMMDLRTSFETVKESEDQHMPDSPGNALGALKKVVAGRQQRAGMG